MEIHITLRLIKMSDQGGKGLPQTKAFSGSSVAQVVETGVGDCAIESVVVYRDRAEVKRAVPVHLITGENEVIVYDLAECVDKNSIRYILSSFSEVGIGLLTICNCQW